MIWWSMSYVFTRVSFPAPCYLSEGEEGEDIVAFELVVFEIFNRSMLLKVIAFVASKDSEKSDKSPCMENVN